MDMDIEILDRSSIFLYSVSVHFNRMDSAIIQMVHSSFVFSQECVVLASLGRFLDKEYCRYEKRSGCTFDSQIVSKEENS